MCGLDLGGSSQTCALHRLNGASTSDLAGSVTMGTIAAYYGLTARVTANGSANYVMTMVKDGHIMIRKYV